MKTLIYLILLILLVPSITADDVQEKEPTDMMFSLTRGMHDFNINLRPYNQSVYLRIEDTNTPAYDWLWIVPEKKYDFIDSDSVHMRWNIPSGVEYGKYHTVINILDVDGNTIESFNINVSVNSRTVMTIKEFFSDSDIFGVSFGVVSIITVSLIVLIMSFFLILRYIRGGLNQI